MHAPRTSLPGLALLGSLALADPAHAAKAKKPGTSAHIEVFAKTNLWTEIVAQSSSLTVAEQNGELVLTTNLYQLGFGSQAFTTKFRQAFQVGPTTKAKLAIPLDELVYPAVGESATGDVAGAFTLHGVTKPVTVDYDVTHVAGDHYMIAAQFEFQYTQFGVAKICVFTACVEPTVEISVDELQLVEI
jgi:hypothetical protein